MKEFIRRKAIELGFDDCRFTTANPPESAPSFQAWLNAHHHGEMAYLERNAARRVNPTQVLDGARTILTLAASYAQAGDEHGATGKSKQTGAADISDRPTQLAQHGFVARYARYRDYHRILGDRLKALTEIVARLGGNGIHSLWYVDTGPLLERDLAQRSGLGFIGKHTNLISRRLGNWIFLAEIITTLELEPDGPETNRCGTCSRCITACPTAAIRAPFKLDARRCISYLTIELKGSIPVQFRPLIGNRIYGCDDCLAVCPWNKFAREGEMMKPHAKPELDAPHLAGLLALDEDRFKSRFAGTPMMRTKRRGLLRNVCVALGNTADARALPALENACRNEEPLIAEHARWAIEQIEARSK